ncbi:unnamed protein product [Lactuca virosa]|uniref:Poly [ADP-ribose] polymerase n=1 Tax=Lactuca virosa TaxID=75947 RepID=A0AAU9LTZ6_9ASTR|nr:unnamed protein product [Lactuca virosa]
MQMKFHEELRILVGKAIQRAPATALKLEKGTNIAGGSNDKDQVSNDWALELEEVFTVEIQGEFDKFVPYKINSRTRCSFGMHMDKPPKGKDPTKGLGKKIPNESEHIKWKDDVVVPCGNSVSSNVKAYELMYNEYIVYNTDQKLVDCFSKQKKLCFDLYKIEATEESKSMVTVKVKERSAVHEAPGLQDSGDILEHGKSIYNTTLSLSDLSTGINSYYILQINEEDKGSGYYVFRKWGRVSNEKIGGNKLEELSKSDAIQQFKRLFLEKTGNSWEAWERKKLQKQPGRFYPLEIVFLVPDGQQLASGSGDTTVRLWDFEWQKQSEGVYLKLSCA